MKKTHELIEVAKNFPKDPGVYLMKDAAGKVLYIGKAKILRSRIMNYFNEQDTRYQIKFLMSKIAALDFVVTDTEKEALILENVLIKKHRPKYNMFLRDDKTYVSIALTLSHSFPRVYLTRKIIKNGSLYFGPYSNGSAAREVVQQIESYFKLRTCSDHDFANRSRPCLQYQIKRCDAPCVDFIKQEQYQLLVDQVKLFLSGRSVEMVSQLQQQLADFSEHEQYEEAARVRDLLRHIDTTLEKQKMEQHQASRSMDVVVCVREANVVVFYVWMLREGKLQDKHHYSIKTHDETDELLRVFLLQYYQEGKFIPQDLLLSINPADVELMQQVLSERAGHKVYLQVPQMGMKHDYIELATKNALEILQRDKLKIQSHQEKLQQLQSKLGLSQLPHKMECYDISNIQGTSSVGSMVTFIEGIADKSYYRQFQIKTVDGSNDFASLYEVLYRRCKKHLDNPADEKWALPNLIVIDGGLGQLSVGVKLLAELNLSNIVDIISLAKSRLKEDKSSDEKIRTEERVFLPNRRNPVILPG